MGRIPEEVVRKVIESSDIVDIISEYVNLKKSGRGYMGVCPFHNDKGPSLSVSQDKQVFHCFGCGAAGNVVGFIMKIRNLDYKDAIIYLAERLGIDVTYTETKDKNSQIKERLYKANLEAARFYYANLQNSSFAKKYLENRGISTKVINRFGLGYSLNEWDALIKFLKSKGFTIDELILAGLAVKSEKGVYDRFRNRIMFPIMDIKGRVIAFGGRVCDDSKPKYLNTSETPVFEKGKNLYGLNYVVKNKLPNNIVIVEGYMDCIKLHQFGLNNVVASLGTALTSEQSKLIKRYVRDVYICYDSDAAGQAATLRGLELLESVDLNVKVITIPMGKDPDEFVNLYGIDEFKNLMNSAIYITDYRIMKAKEGKDIKNPLEKSKFVNEVIEIISKLKDSTAIQHYAELLSNETGLNINVIIDKINKLNLNVDKKNNNLNLRHNIKGNIYNIIPAYKKAECLLLSLSLHNDKLFDYIFSRMSEDDFITSVYKKAAGIIYSKKTNKIEITENELLMNFHDKDDIQDITRIIYNELDYSEDLYKMAEDAIKTIKKYQLEEKINDVKNKIKIYEENNQIKESLALMQELVNLQKELSLL
ncbi:MAG: DNA primase [Clostridiales bacterium]|nr:DNA primase [Clostridiales bacterium]